MGPKFGKVGVSGNHQDEANVVSQVDGDSNRYGTHLCVQAKLGEGSTKEQWLFPALLSGIKLPLQLLP